MPTSSSRATAVSGRVQPLRVLPWQERWSTSYLHWLYVAASGTIADHFAPLGVQWKHHGLLATLNALGPVTQAELCVMSGVDRTTMSQTIDDMERLGLVQRRTSPRNRRANAVDITDAGSTRLRELDEVRETAETDLFSGLSVEQRAQFLDILQTIYDHRCTAT